MDIHTSFPYNGHNQKTTQCLSIHEWINNDTSTHQNITQRSINTHYWQFSNLDLKISSEIKNKSQKIFSVISCILPSWRLQNYNHGEQISRGQGRIEGGYHKNRVATCPLIPNFASLAWQNNGYLYIQRDFIPVNMIPESNKFHGLLLPIHEHSAK